ncbi:ATP-binding protein [Lysinibacillus louembei]
MLFKQIHLVEKSGLGLSIVHKIIEMHGDSIEINSKLGTVITFTVV